MFCLACVVRYLSSGFGIFPGSIRFDIDTMISATSIKLLKYVKDEYDFDAHTFVGKNYLLKRLITAFKLDNVLMMLFGLLFTRSLYFLVACEVVSKIYKIFPTNNLNSLIATCSYWQSGNS